MDKSAGFGAARAWHLLTTLVAAGAVLLQLVLVWQGHAVLDQTDPPPLGTRLVRFISYFTILSNLLVVWSTATLAAGADRDTRTWRVLRLNAVVGIAVTGLVHWFLLRPILDLEGIDFVVDKLLHVAVPLLAVVGWAVFGPRGRVRTEDLAWGLIFPVGWLAYTLVRGASVDFYPYPFLDVNEHGYAVVAANSIGVALLLLGLSALALWADRRLPGAERVPD